MKHFKDEEELKRTFRLFLCAMFCYGVVEGFSLNIFSNFFKDAYSVSDQVRGLIETPREAPGVFCMFYLPALAALSDVRLAMAGIALDALAMFLMGVLDVPFGVMMVLLLIFSFGSHTYYPMENSLGTAIAGETRDVGATLGKIKAVSQTAYFFAASCVFVFFRTGYFDFTARIKRPFVWAAVACCLALLFLSRMRSAMDWMPKRRKGKLVFRREFAPYYLLNFANGVQKRVRMVFALWMFTQLLDKKADFTAILLIASAAVGIGLSPLTGKLLDRMGPKRAIKFEGLYMIAVFGVYGFVARGFARGTLEATDPVLAFCLALFVAADMTKFFDFFHNFILKGIARRSGLEDDLSSTFSVGQALDHIMAISVSPLFGVMWAHLGPQSVFWTCAVFSAVQLAVARGLSDGAAQTSAQR